jgi:predicted restriction endonuclease
MPEFLNASHIIPWSKDERMRVNPGNGLSLCVLHDRAFDRGLITLNDNLTILVSDKLIKAKISPGYFEHALKINGAPIQHPEKFAPLPEAIKFHRDEIFNKSE